MATPPILSRSFVIAALALAACAPTLTFNQSFLVPEELKVAPNGYASLKSTGEKLRSRSHQGAGTQDRPD